MSTASVDALILTTDWLVTLIEYKGVIYGRVMIYLDR